MSAPIKEALLEGGRVVLLAVVSWLLTGVVLTNIVAAVVGTHLDANTQLIITGILTTGLRAVDKWLHENGKDTDKAGMLGMKGLTGF